MANITALLTERKQLLNQLNSMYYGSIEIRQKDDKQYIYVHFRQDGDLTTKYVGEYSDVLYNLVINNTNHARELKKRLKEINKELKELDYVDVDGVDEMVAMNIDLARRNLVDSIYKQSMLEGVATTYSDTETLVNGGKVNDMTASDVDKVINLKRAWEFIMSIDLANYPTNYAVLCQINQIVEDGFSVTAGKIRKVPVTIGGSSYIPPIPFEDQVKSDIHDILHKEDGIDLAIDLILYVMKKQLFLDGNKRTAIIFANHYLITHALGLIVVPSELVSDYKKILVAYYEDESKKEDISNFLKDKCWIKIA
ncbi:MAG: Fic family protein [Bacilli bacterium]|nr:Fic family protein [Bacilli bacterium]